MLEDIQKNFERMIALYEREREMVKQLSIELDSTRKANETLRKHNTELEKEIDDLKLAAAFLSVSGEPEAAKARVDKLIKEINKCISLLER
ncbi:MAG: hypothetical protein PUC53_05185 [Bacteroidales bacterium]|nr:hypothetical protein [Bacteroidales bacterium]